MPRVRPRPSPPFQPRIRRALSLPASNVTGTIADVQHVVILMQENRSFDHYFGTLRGVRGFGDRHPVPLASGKPVWFQSDGEQEIPPFHLDTKTTSALRVPGTPHTFTDAQAAWNQGQVRVLAEVQDANFDGPLPARGYSVSSSRSPRPLRSAMRIIARSPPVPIPTASCSGRARISTPSTSQRGENCTDADAEVNNLRCWIKGTLPTPGYTYQGSAFTWPTIPDVLERAGI